MSAMLKLVEEFLQPNERCREENDEAWGETQRLADESLERAERSIRSWEQLVGKDNGRAPEHPR